MTEAASIAAWLLMAGGSALSLMGLFSFWRERRALVSLLHEVAPGGHLRDRAQLIDLRRRLSTQIRWDPERMHERRPLLRASAARVLASGHGFCGENARVAVRLLRLGGVPAHRLYLEGERWGHVVVEHRWRGGWRLFDAHADPRTALGDEDVGRLDSDDLGAFPNRVPENAWTGSYRIPGLRRLPFAWAGRMRPPAPLTVLAETPALVLATAGALLVLVGIMLLASG